MTKLLCTIWALVLNGFGVSIFRTCFANAMEDDEGEALISGPPITSFFFASGVYTIILSSTLFPTNFRKPKAYLLCAYEFLATAFLLEFAVACIWTPIDVLILTNIPNALCKVFVWLDMNSVGNIVTQTKIPMTILSCGLTFAFFLLSLHVTKSLDFTLLMDCGWNYFLDYTIDRLWERIVSEFPRTKQNRSKKKRGRNRRSR